VLPEGVHRVQVEGLLPNVSEWEWAFHLKPRRVEIQAPGWNVSGVRPDGVPEQQVFFSLQQRASGGEAAYDSQELITVALVERRIELGLVWQVHTTVTRLSPTGRAISLKVPLLQGENVLTPNAVVEISRIEVRLGANENSTSWRSELPVSASLDLKAGADDVWVESWRVVVSPVWNLAYSGLAPVFEQGIPELVPVWRPWPGEEVELKISRPEAVPGETVTVDRVSHEVSLGQRQRVSRLDLSIRASLGEDFLIRLSEGAEITSLTHSGASIPVRNVEGKIVVPLRPGTQDVSVGWKVDLPLEMSASVGEVLLPVKSANINTTLRIPEDRWILWAHGPLRGPAVQFWTILACSLIAAWALSRVRHSPLRASAWMLLALGLTQVSLPSALLVVAWLFFLTWRGRESFQRIPALRFNLLQILLVGVTVVALGVFIAVVGQGLLGRPEMFLSGNGSTRSALIWYAAEAEDLLPDPGCISVSIWWYRFAMLAWALWLAVSLLRWLAWGWKQFSEGGCFRAMKPKPTPPPIPETGIPS
jgi:hypothetical protein